MLFNCANWIKRLSYAKCRWVTSTQRTLYLRMWLHAVPFFFFGFLFGENNNKLNCNDTQKETWPIGMKRIIAKSKNKNKHTHTMREILRLVLNDFPVTIWNGIWVIPSINEIRCDFTMWRENNNNCIVSKCDSIQLNTFYLMQNTSRSLTAVSASFISFNNTFFAMAFVHKKWY